MITSKSKIKGRVRGVVISLDEIGIAKLEALRVQYPERKANSDYVLQRDLIYRKHGFRKKRTTWNFLVFVTMLQCMLRAKFQEAFQVFQFEMGVNHNIVTDEGDALVADLMAQTPARTKVDNTNGHIEVGTGWTGTTPKQNTSCNTPTGNPEVMDATYPVLKGTWGNTDDNVVQYRATFEAGDLNQTGINEAALINNSVAASGDCLAYGQITPAVDVSSTDTLQVDWELTFLGA